MGTFYFQKQARNVQQCSHCGHFAMARASRHGFWQVKVLPLFGLYPWQCMTCGASALLRDRGVAGQTASSQKGPVPQSPLPRH